MHKNQIFSFTLHAYLCNNNNYIFTLYYNIPFQQIQGNLLLSTILLFQSTEVSQYIQKYCEKNQDCVDPSLCCSITPALGKRFLDYPGNLDKDFMVHYCLPYKTENATWCTFKLQYSPEIPNYHGLCPCGPGLKCTPTTDLDPKYYPRDKFGKCTKINS